MQPSPVQPVAPDPKATATMLQDLQREMIPFLLPGFYLVAILLIGAINWFSDPLLASLPALLLLLLLLLVLWLHHIYYEIAAWTLIIGSLVITWVLTFQSGILPVLSLVALPVGLAVLLVHPTAGILTASFCTLFLFLYPPAYVSVEPFARVVVLIHIWGMVWLVCLGVRALHTTLAWSWSNYHQSRNTLEQARDYQFQLGRALEDLADANLQLTRLNRLAQAMRMHAEDARQIKERFVANVSHELRTPLNMIVGFIGMIMQAPHTYAERIPQSLLADLEIVYRNSMHLSALIDDVLDLSQIETGQMALTKQYVALSHIIESAATAVRPLFQTKGLYLRQEVSAELPPIYCDGIRLQQVILNLLSNAGRFTQSGGVCVRAWREEEDVIVSVVDTGPGIDDMDGLFQPFHQVDSPISKTYGGSGLGLSISKGIVELHDGKMWIEPGKESGTAVLFRLQIDVPRHQPDHASRWFTPYIHYKERSSPSMAPVPRDRPRVVILEREGALQRLLLRYASNVEPVAVTGIEDAVDEIQRVPTQALLINEASETKVCSRLRRGFPVYPMTHRSYAVLCRAAMKRPGSWER